MPDMSSPLSALVNIISSQVSTLESSYRKAGTPYPSLEDNFAPTALDADPAVANVTRTIIAAASHLIAMVQSPMESLQEHAAGAYSSGTLGLVNELSVANVLQEAGPQGAHVKDIAAKVGIEKAQLARTMRYLVTRHIFREVTPDVFTNNRVSSLLVKRKTLDEIKADPLSQYEGSPASALIGHFTDEPLMGIPYFVEFMKSPGGYQSPFNVAIKDKTNIFAWFDHPDRQWRARRFVAAMKGGADRFPSTIFTKAIDWAGLPAGSTVVDVGGNVGSVALDIAKTAPKLRYIVQDLEGPIKEANEFWNAQWPEAIRNGTVKLEVHDFFLPMKIPADVFIMRLVVHDWPEAESIKIMKNLRDGAKKSTKLILFEMLVPHACRDTSALAATGPEPPYPLLANLGIGAGGFVTMVDMQMLTLSGGRERTIEEFEELGKSSGWKLESVQPGPLATFIYVPL